MTSETAGEDESAAPNNGADLDFGVAGANPKFKEVARFGLTNGFGLAIIWSCCLGGAHLLVSSPGCVPAMMERVAIQV